MVKSMTGFGRAQKEIDGMSISVEIKSVNHKGFEFGCKTPRTYGFIDDKLKSLVQSLVARGKIECYVMISALDTDDCVVEINHSLAGGYYKALKELAERYSLRDDISVSSLCRCSNDIFVVRKAAADEDAVWEAVKSVALEAIDSFVKMREVEGGKLKEDVISRSKIIIGNVEFIEQRSPQTVKEYNDKLLERMKVLLGDVNIDEQRLLTEAAIFADKVAVAEETVRLRSHIDQLHTLLDSGEPVGRKLDFLAQEMNREANTIGSKCQDVDITKRVLEIKAEVEKIREQIQNIE